ncbi:MAG: hypothetical protein FWE46_03575, partial [Coriobacteriia bacterium]|nr:hypothetical protein [Coriobacteriia bacterium]
TLGDLAQMDLRMARSIFGKTAETMLERAAGLDERLVKEDEPVKSVSNEYTFNRDISTVQEVRDALTDISAQVGRRLRKKNLRGRCVSLKLRCSDFTTHSASKTFHNGIDNEVLIAKIAFELACGIWSEGTPLRLLGVGVSHFDDEAAQMCLFGDEALVADDAAAAAAPAVSSEQREKLSSRVDDIKDKFGEGSVLSGRQLKQAAEDKPWRARSITGGPKPSA